MNRVEMVQQILTLEAVANAAKARAEVLRLELSTAARAELEEQGTAPTWRMPELGTVQLPLSQESFSVRDPEALAAWVAKRYPTEVQTKPVVRPSFVGILLETAKSNGDAACDPETGEVIPGMAVRSGGQPQSLRVTPDRDAKAAFAAVGELLVARILDPEPIVLAEVTP